MKQLIFMVVLTLVGTVGTVTVSPFYGVAVYYLFAVLRPQFIWQWVLPQGISWSFYVAITTILTLLFGHFGPSRGQSTPNGTGERRPTLSGAHRMVLLFGAWIALTYFTARNREWAYPFFIEYLKIFVMFAVSTRIIRSVKQLWTLFLIAAVALGYIAYEVNDIYLFQGSYNYIYEMGFGGLDNNGAGLMLAMGVPLCYFAWEGMRRKWRWAFLALIPFILHAVLMSFSRGAMVSLIAAIPFYLLRSRRRLELSLVLFGIALLIPILAGPQIQARFFTLERNEVDESANARRQAWKAAWAMATDNPIFGVGLRNADLFSFQYGADMEGRTIHSQYFQTAADSGFVGLALYLGALGTVWANTRRVRRAAAGRTDLESVRVYAMASGVETSMIVFCVGAAFLSLENFELPYLLLLIGAQLPVVYRGPIEVRENSTMAEMLAAQRIPAGVVR